MAVTHETATQNAASDAVVDLLDAGSTDANADLVYRTSGDVEVATLAMSNPAYGGSASGVATAAAISDDTSATGGTIAKATQNDRDNNIVMTCSVTATSGGGDIELSSVAIGSGDTVSTSSLTYQALIA